MVRGLTTVNYLADHVAAAVDWYTELLGVEPYFSRPVEPALRRRPRVALRQLT